MGTGTDLKPVQIPEIPDLPEIEMDLCDIYGQKQIYEKNRFFRVLFFQKFQLFEKCPNVPWYVIG